jgi:hypothetical protein
MKTIQSILSMPHGKLVRLAKELNIHGVRLYPEQGRLANRVILQLRQSRSMFSARTGFDARRFGKPQCFNRATKELANSLTDLIK